MKRRCLTHEELKVMKKKNATGISNSLKNTH